MIKYVNDILLNILWGKPMIFLIIMTGLFMTVRTRFFHIRHLSHVLKHTILSLFKSETQKSGDEKAISRFQTISTALAGTMGTGNIVGVSAALSIGGAGTVFWMWLSAIIGMMTKFSENVLAVYFREKNKNGQWCGGAMYYIKNGLKQKCLLNPLAKPLSVLFSFFCLAASFGVGNMVQINSVSNILLDTWHIPLIYTGIFASLLVFIIIIRGLKSIVKVTERIIPLMSIIYIAACITVMLSNFPRLPLVFESIFKNAFGFKAAFGAAAGMSLKGIITLGFKRGIFSNEAGLGASSIVHSCSDTKEPVEQGMWGIFEVFFDTIVSCTLTATAILSSGIAFENRDAISLVSGAFSTIFGEYAGGFLAVMLSLFAFSTVIGWSFYGIKSLEYLAGGKYVTLYKIIYSLAVVMGATLNLTLVWEISDTLNALMAIPNLFGIIFLSGTVAKITDNYVKRKIYGKKIKPITSAFKNH